MNIFGGVAQLIEHLPCTQRAESLNLSASTIWLVGQAVKTLPLHGSIGGSIPPRVTKWEGTRVAKGGRLCQLKVFTQFNSED